jgi:hypothetical protein
MSVGILEFRRTVSVGRGCGTGDGRGQVCTDQSLGLSHHQIRYHQTSQTAHVGQTDINVHGSIYVTVNIQVGSAWPRRVRLFM